MHTLTILASANIPLINANVDSTRSYKFVVLSVIFNKLCQLFWYYFLFLIKASYMLKLQVFSTNDVVHVLSTELSTIWK